MILLTRNSPWVKLSGTNFTNASFGTLKSTLTRPSGAGVLDFADDAAAGGAVPNGLVIRPFGTDTANQTAKMRVWGWAPCISLSPTSWENLLLCQIALTLGNIQGAAGCAITASDFEVDTLAVTYGNANVSVEIVDTHDDTRGASVLVDTKGFPIVQIEFDRNSSAASLNAIVKRL